MADEKRKRKPEEGEISSIRISKELKERLRRRGEMGKSYEDVIRELLEKVERTEKKGR